MIKKNILIISTAILFFVPPSFAFTNICEVAAKAFDMTTAQMDDLYDKEIKEHRVEGNGKIYDVRKGGERTESACTIVVACGNNVLVYIHAGDYWGSKKDLKIGQQISFTGDCKKKLEGRFYRGSDKRYIEVIVTSASLHY
jgi:hypothetical protein